MEGSTELDMGEGERADKETVEDDDDAADDGRESSADAAVDVP